MIRKYDVRRNRREICWDFLSLSLSLLKAEEVVLNNRNHDEEDVYVGGGATYSSLLLSGGGKNNFEGTTSILLANRFQRKNERFVFFGFSSPYLIHQRFKG